ncbi:hypothetical protein RR48_02841 [Papilio machaon]|uniref:Uncharacterized protein n=1 Tax=Papilio machaon TaxID=76193 RepID=A0A0N0PED0_PAPMA|nr:hypothetical protein RR48_02841 [Papilio machaon]
MCEVNIPRQKAPKDGVGPRGVPECYYTSRVLNSTFRYVKFVRKLRALEEEQRKGAENKAKEEKDQTINEFFMKCDRKSLINDVARRVDLCLASYQKDLEVKKERLKELFAYEEEENTRKFVAQAQAGAELVWQDKKERLRFLLEKRKKEHAEKYKDTPLLVIHSVQSLDLGPFKKITHYLLRAMRFLGLESTNVTRCSTRLPSF